MKTQLLPFALAALSFSGPGAGAARPLHALRRLGVSRARLVGTAAGAPLPSQRGDQSDDEQLGSAVESSQSADGKLASALYKFSRPHTIRGTVLASFAGVARALIEHPGAISLTLVPQALLGLLALGLGNVWIVGVNQIYDVDVDRINKPFLPVAAGELSPALAWVIVLCSLAGGLLTVHLAFSKLIFALYAGGLFIGGLYSVPPVQLKRFPIAAGLIISTVRGFLLNFGVYYAIREAIKVPFSWNPVVCFIAAFMTVFASVIAVTKDLPDVAGDAAYKVDTLATRHGVATVARYACTVLAGAYAFATALALFAPAGIFRRLPMAAGHALLGLKVVRTFQALRPDSLSSIKRFYGGIWQVFYLQYVLYPFI